MKLYLSIPLNGFLLGMRGGGHIECLSIPLNGFR